MVRVRLELKLGFALHVFSSALLRFACLSCLKTEADVDCYVVLVILRRRINSIYLRTVTMNF